MAEFTLTFTQKEFDEAVERELNRRVQAIAEQIAKDGGWCSQHIAIKGSIPKPTAEEILESIRKIFDQFSWEYGSDDRVYADIDYKLWDNLKSLLREDGPGKVWRV